MCEIGFNNGTLVVIFRTECAVRIARVVCIAMETIQTVAMVTSVRVSLSSRRNSINEGAELAHHHTHCHTQRRQCMATRGHSVVEQQH